MGDAETPSSHHRRPRRPIPVRGRPHLRRLPRLDQPPHGPLRDESVAAFVPRSRAPKTSPGATSRETVELVLRLRKQLDEAGLDAGADTIDWHLPHHHQTTLARASINRIRIVTAVTGELLRELTIHTSKDYQPRTPK